MHRLLVISSRLGVGLALVSAAAFSLGAAPQRRPDRRPPKPTQGTLAYVNKAGEALLCPLKHTSVRADIAGPIARQTTEPRTACPLREVSGCCSRLPHSTDPRRDRSGRAYKIGNTPAQLSDTL